MPLAKTDIIPRETPPAIPIYQLSDDQLAPFLFVLPPLIGRAPGWHLGRRKPFRRGIAALQPTDRAQGYIAVYVVICRHVAKILTGRAGARWNSPKVARVLGRQAVRMTRIGDDLERTLRREQKIAARLGGGRAAASPGLPGKEAAWRNDPLQREVLGLASVAPASPAVAFGVTGAVQGKAAVPTPEHRRQCARQTPSGRGPALGGAL